MQTPLNTTISGKPVFGPAALSRLQEVLSRATEADASAAVIVLVTVGGRAYLGVHDYRRSHHDAAREVGNDLNQRLLSSSNVHDPSVEPGVSVQGAMLYIAREGGKITATIEGRSATFGPLRDGIFAGGSTHDVVAATLKETLSSIMSKTGQPCEIEVIIRPAEQAVLQGACFSRSTAGQLRSLS